MKHFPIQEIRADFPILQQKINGKPLIYFDNAATSQTPKQVTQTLVDYYENTNANIHRGVHTLSQKATDAFEESRKKIQKFFNAVHPHEIIITSGTTHGINLVAHGMKSFLTKGDEVLVSAIEHHSNIVPWQMMCAQNGCQLKVIPVLDNGHLDMDAYKNLLTTRTKMVFVNHVSNALGTINPVQRMIKMAHSVGAKILIDGAQSCAHLKPDVQKLDADFYVSSAHKMYGPTGVGVLYGKESLLQKMDPYQGGGEMIAEVTFEKTTYAALPHKFEAGTPNICGVIAFGAAIDYMNHIGMENIKDYENALLEYATDKLNNLGFVKIYGAHPKTPVLSFNIEKIHPYDIGSILDQMGIAVRTGHHCAQPLMNRFKIPGTVRASFACYNTFAEIDAFIEAVQKAYKMLS